MTALSAKSPSFSPLRLTERSLAWQVAAVITGTGLLAACSYITVPMVPVPVTMQTFAVCTIGALYGWRLGAITIIAWLAEAALGAPVLAGGSAGIAKFVGPTAGYLFAFPAMGALCGWLAERGWNGHRPVLAFVSMLAANLLCLALGGAWLAIPLGLEKALAVGVTPFIVGGVLKSALGAACLAALTRKAPKNA